MEDNLKISKVENLSKHFLDHTQMLNLSLDDHTIFYKYLKWRRPQILKMEYLSNHLMDQRKDDLKASRTNYRTLGTLTGARI
jgi:hypothetical protein